MKNKEKLPKVTPLRPSGKQLLSQENTPKERHVAA
jgi:hypothetical protein